MEKKLARMSNILRNVLISNLVFQKNFHRAKNLMLNVQNYKSIALDDIIINACKFMRHLKITVSDKFLHLVAIDK